MAFVSHGTPCDKEALSTAAWADGDAIVPDDSNDDSGASPSSTPVDSWPDLLTEIDKGTADITLSCDISRIPDDTGDIDDPKKAALTISSGKTLTINLNGRTLDGSGLGRVITVENGGILTIKNSVGTPGTITGGDAAATDAAGGAVTIQDNVEITDDSATNGGGIYVADGGTVTIQGNVEITGNTATGLGGGVYNAGTFTMNGGAIYGNSAETAAADFYNVGAEGCTFTLALAKEGYAWYVDGPEGKRYTGTEEPCTNPESGSGTEEATYLAAEVTLVKEGNFYQISNAEQLAAFRDIVNGSNGGDDYLDACAELTADIDLSTVCGKEIGSWTPIGLGDSGAYNGTFDGNGNTIFGLYCSVSAKGEAGEVGEDVEDVEAIAGLFHTIGDGGEVRALNVKDSSVSIGGKGDNSSNSGETDEGGDGKGGTAGGICATNSGAITGCTFSGTVRASGAISTAGGICGQNNSPVEGSPCIIENCRNDGSVYAGNGTSLNAGGVCGYNAGEVRNCLNTGEVAAETEDKYVTANSGGVCGCNNNGGTVTNCYYPEESGLGGIGGGNDQEKATPTTRTELESGAVAYLLNGEKAGEDDTAPWRQDLDSVGEAKRDAHPVLDASHGVVYPIVENGKIVRYSNYPNGEPDTGGGTGGGSSSGGDSYDDSEPTYSPSLDVSDGGSIKVSPRTPEAGETVTITPTPEAGYDVDTVTVTDRSGREVEVTEHRNSTWTFTQPRGRVTIEVTFRKTGPEAPALRRRARGLLGRDGHPVCLRRGPDGRHQRLRLQPRRHHLPPAGVDDPGPAGRLRAGGHGGRPGLGGERRDLRRLEPRRPRDPPAAGGAALPVHSAGRRRLHRRVGLPPGLPGRGAGQRIRLRGAVLDDYARRHHRHGRRHAEPPGHRHASPGGGDAGAVL